MNVPATRPKETLIYDTISSCGAVAQLGERRVRNAKVGSSILLGSTNPVVATTDIQLPVGMKEFGI